MHSSAAPQDSLEQGHSQEAECCTAQHHDSHMEDMDAEQLYAGSLKPSAAHAASYDPTTDSRCRTTTPTSSSQEAAAIQQALGSSPGSSTVAAAGVAAALSGSSRRHAPGWRKKAHPYRAPIDLGILEGTTTAARPRQRRPAPSASTSPRPSSQDFTQDRFTPGVDQHQGQHTEGEEGTDQEDRSRAGSPSSHPKRMSQRSSARSYVPRLRRQRHELTGPCSNCSSVTSPQWRKGPPGKPVLCNACGIRYHRTKSLHVPPVRGTALKRNVVVTVGQRPPWLRHPGAAEDSGTACLYPEALPWAMEPLPQPPAGYPHTWEGPAPGPAPAPAQHGPERGLDGPNPSRRHRHHPYQYEEQQAQQQLLGSGSTEEETLVGGRSPRRRALSQRALEALAVTGPASDPDAGQHLLMKALGGAGASGRGSPASSSGPWPHAQQPMQLAEVEEEVDRSWGVRGARGREEGSPGLSSTCHMDLLAAAAADVSEQDREPCQQAVPGGSMLRLPPAPTASARCARPSPLLMPTSSLAELLQPGGVCSSAAATPSSSCSSAAAVHMLRQASVTGGLALPPAAPPAAAGGAPRHTPDYISAVMALKDRTGSIDAALDLLLGGCGGLGPEQGVEPARSSGGGEDSSGTARTYVVVRARARGPRRAGSGAERGEDGDGLEETSLAAAAQPELAEAVWA